jgi:predicted ThiF/HesA family dinucleotide-utilizing enzyme
MSRVRVAVVGLGKLGMRCAVRMPEVASSFRRRRVPVVERARFQGETFHEHEGEMQVRGPSSLGLESPSRASTRLSEQE